ncbi:cathepsin E-like [Amphibalanus amphitrite]|uniref:cathepsin E-like n=1 Tax=Amphibalanus amphitrite TaxID=1232801 RepID=UPI001C8FF8BA|nr:cathepsin E-like [Amphibalanus amphitrite]
MLRLLLALSCAAALNTAPGTVYVPLRDVFQAGQQFFVGDLEVGTPGQPMSVIVAIDGLTCLNSVRCSDPYCTSHRQYDASASSTYQEDGTPFDLPGGLNISGVLSKDSVSLGGATVSDVLFGEATSVWNQWSTDAPNDGVLGLGFSPAAPSILDALAEQGVIADRLAGIWLGRDGVGGELTLGGINEQRYTSPLTWTPIVDNMVSAESVTVGEVSVCAADCRVGATSVSPYFFLTMQMAKTINDALGGTDIGQPGVAALDCATLDTLPPLELVIAGRSLQMSPRQYTVVIPLTGGESLCLSGFVGLSEVPPADITVGTLFMQQFYAAYDMDNMQVGFTDSA